MHGSALNSYKQFLLLITADINGKLAKYDEWILIHPAQISCTLSSAIDNLK